ncbi:MAG: Fic family protein [Nitrospirae bacterium]|nr:Fic family protein [Nitrospirota bacterium]
MLNSNKRNQKGKLDEKASKKAQHKKPAEESGKVAEKPRRYKLSQESLSGKGAKLGSKVHGVREGACGYRPPEGTSGEGEDSTQPIDSTRYFETVQGIKSYSEIYEIIAVAVTKAIEKIIDALPERIQFTTDWICTLHKDIAGSLFDWAGRFRNVNVQVGQHTPPSFYEVPALMKLYCDDLSTRLSSAEKTINIKEIAELLAWADWRFQWIHPFRDLNGRIGRILLTAILIRLKLPPTETASVESREKQEYLKAIRLADKQDLSVLTEIWLHRLLKGVKEDKGK